MSKNIICVVYVNDFMFWKHSQSKIGNVMKSFKEDWPSYSLEHSKGESVSEFLSIDIQTLDDGGFKFYQTGLIRENLEGTGMELWNG